MANAGQSRATTILLWLSGIAVIGLIIFGVRTLTRDVIEVRVVPVTYQTLSSTVSTNGKVEPIEDFQAHAPFAGSIKQIFVSVGQQVTKGTLLVKMDDAEARGRLAGAQARLANDQLILRDLGKGGSTEDLSRFGSDITNATVEQQHAATELETRKKLLAQGAASPAEVAAAQQRLDTANLTLQNAQKHSLTRYDAGDLENARTRVADSRAALASAEDNLENVDIHSPIAGTVYDIPVNQFDFVQFAQTIVEVADLKRIQVRAFFDEPEIGKLEAGQSVKIVWDAKRDHVWHGHVSLAPTTIYAYQGTRNVGICLITIDDPTPDLIPNTNVTLTVTESERPHVLSIPREALHTDGARSFVYRIVNGRLAETNIKTGVVSLTNVEIQSGLKENDLVVTGAKTSLTELSSGLEVKQVQ